MLLRCVSCGRAGLVSAPVRVRPVPPAAVAPPGGGRTARGARAVLFGAAAGGVVMLGRLSGAFDGVAGLVVVVVLLLLVPTSRQFARRVLLTGCLVLGWTQLLWWVPLPVGAVGRITIAMAAVAAGLGAWVGAGARPTARLAALLPRLRLVDLLIPISAGLGGVLLTPWLQAKSLGQTFGLLLGGWDHSAHFSMVHMIRRYGATLDAIPPPAEGTWQFTSYPEGYHTVVASIIETMIGPRLGTIDVELLAYTRAIAWLVIAIVAVLVAGFCALPALRNRPALAAPVAALVASVIYLGPGATAIQGGFGNFTMSCALVVALVLVLVPMARVFSPVHLAAAGSAFGGVAAGWVLMMALAVPALLVLLFPLRRSRYRASRRAVLATVLVVLVTLAVLARTATVLLHLAVANPLVLTGGIDRPSLGLVVLAVLATIGSCMLVPWRGRGARIRVLALLPIAGAAVAAALAVMQIRAGGSVTYYGLKFMTGMEIVLLPVLLVGVAHALARRPRLPRAGGVAAALLLALAATQVFGLAAPDRGAEGLASEAPGAVNRAAQIRSLVTPPATSDLAERVVGYGSLPQPVFFLDAPSDGRVDPILAAQWVFSLTDDWTAERNAVAGGIQLGDRGPADLAAAARKILLQSPGSYVAVRRSQLALLLQALDDQVLAGRIIAL